MFVSMKYSIMTIDSIDIDSMPLLDPASFFSI